LAQIIKQNQLI